ncbi:MAG: UDP-N-acetylmuramate dehydrogenase [Candidatus Sericytochromatia bacterium]|nr:UDP-N-acetylmuramate dehydrogenase [Candidatus Sericytochromatia bacterium]
MLPIKVDTTPMTLPAGIRENVSLSSFNTWQVGGSARYFIEPVDLSTLQVACRWATEHQVPWRALGRGSNVLVADEGFDGLVIRLGAHFSSVDITDQEGHALVRAQAGVPCAQFVVSVNQAGFGGVEPLVGVPGSLGGAVAMNASAHGLAVSDHFLEGLVLDGMGQVQGWSKEDFQFAYRHSRLQDEPLVFLEGFWLLPPVDRQAAREKIRELQRWRNEKQPTNFPSGGSTFRNPGDGLPAAGALIEAIGAKGYQVGQAQVSEKHANFIVNRGGATADDINSVIIYLQKAVEARYGVHLVPEVVGLGIHVGTR